MPSTAKAAKVTSQSKQLVTWTITAATLTILAGSFVGPTAAAAIAVKKPALALETLFGGPICATGALEAFNANDRLGRRHYHIEYYDYLNETKWIDPQSCWYKSVDANWDSFDYPKFYDNAPANRENVHPNTREPRSKAHYHMDIQVFIWMASHLMEQGKLSKTGMSNAMSKDLSCVLTELKSLLCRTEDFINATNRHKRNRYRYYRDDEMVEFTASFHKALEDQGILIVAKVFSDGLNAYFKDALAYYEYPLKPAA